MSKRIQFAVNTPIYTSKFTLFDAHFVCSYFTLNPITQNRNTP